MIVVLLHMLINTYITIGQRRTIMKPHCFWTMTMTTMKPIFITQNCLTPVSLRGMHLYVDACIIVCVFKIFFIFIKKVFTFALLTSLNLK